MQALQHRSSDESVTNSELLLQFAEKYGFTKLKSSPQEAIKAALEQLNRTFFFYDISKGEDIKTYHQIQVVSVALETGLNPFNNELYGIFTPFGFKVRGTIDGWMKISARRDVKLREFTYSDTMEKVNIEGSEYSVPTWVECKVVSESKGTSIAREYFWEIYNNSFNQTFSWLRPARMLSNIAYIQANKRLFEFKGIDDSDTIADINKNFEARMGKAHFPKKNVKLVEVDADESVDTKPSVTEAEVTEEAADTKPTVTEVEVTEEAVNTKPTVTGAKVTEEVESTTTEIPEEVVSREVLTLIKPMLRDVKCGLKPVKWLVQFRAIIKNDLALQWFDQEVNKLS